MKTLPISAKVFSYIFLGAGGLLTASEPQKIDKKQSPDFYQTQAGTYPKKLPGDGPASNRQTVIPNILVFLNSDEPKPQLPFPEEKFKQIITDLDSDKYATRELASKRLRTMVEDFPIDRLEEMAKRLNDEAKSNSLEVRRRIEVVLDSMLPLAMNNLVKKYKDDRFKQLYSYEVGKNLDQDKVEYFILQNYKEHGKGFENGYRTRHSRSRSKRHSSFREKQERRKDE